MTSMPTNSSPRSFNSKGDGVADLAVAGVERPDRLAVDKKDTLVASRHRRDELLRDHRLAADHGVQLQQRVQVGIAGLQLHDARARAAVERLRSNNVAVTDVKVVQRLGVGGDQGRRL